MRQLKIDVLSVLVVTDKLEFGEPQASGILSPAYWRGGKFNSPGRKPWGKVKIVTEPRAERSGWQIWMRVDMQIINA